MSTDPEYLSNYAPDRFRNLAHQWVDRLADHLDQLAKNQKEPVLTLIEPQKRLSEICSAFSEEAEEEPMQLLEQLIAGSIHLHHPNYIGHQVSAPLPLAALIESANALLNNGMAIYEMGPIQSAMEHRVLSFLATELGFPNSAGGMMTSGGSIGNLTALLTAYKAQSDLQSQNIVRPAILVSKQSHYCIRRAIDAMGWEEGGMETIAVDENYRIDCNDLEPALRRAEHRGRKVIAIVANAASTATGSIDPIAKISQFCRQHDLWLHIDGAHGASFVLSPKYRNKLAGIELADSVVWDAHKMMMMPALNTAVILRNGIHARQTFRQEASYLFDKSNEHPEDLNLGRRTLECTKRGMGASLYISLRTLGVGTFREHVTHMFDLSLEFAKLISDSKDFELACPPDCNIICFRHLPRTLASQARDRIDAHQSSIRQRLIESGTFYLVQTDLDKGRFLRCTIINPLTTIAVLKQLLQSIREMAKTPAVATE